MKSPPDPARSPKLERELLLILLALLTVAFAAVLWPFYGAVFWGSVLALLFQPLYRGSSVGCAAGANLAALATLVVILVIVILPLTLVGVSLVQEVTDLYARGQDGEINFGRYFEQIVGVLPSWITGLLDRFGLVDLAGPAGAARRRA